MYIFALEISKYGRGPKKVYHLVINNKDEFDKFEKKYGTKQYRSELRIIGSAIDQMSAGRQLAKSRLKKIHGVDAGYEIRTKSLRVYFLEIEAENLFICLGGLKKNQKNDISRFTKISKALQKELQDGKWPEIKK